MDWTFNYPSIDKSVGSNKLYAKDRILKICEKSIKERLNTKEVGGTVLW